VCLVGYGIGCPKPDWPGICPKLSLIWLVESSCYCVFWNENWFLCFKTCSTVGVYSAAVGVLMWEVFTCGEMPFSGQKNHEVVEQICHQHRHLSQPDNCPETVFTKMLLCWQYVSNCASSAWLWSTYFDVTKLWWVF